MGNRRDAFLLSFMQVIDKLGRDKSETKFIANVSMQTYPLFNFGRDVGSNR